MEVVTIHKTKKTPEVIIDYGNNTMSITGISIPEDVHVFFGAVLNEFKNYRSVKTAIELNVGLVYFNSATSDYLLELFREIARYDNTFKKSSINWYLKKDDIHFRKTVELLEQASPIKFNFRESESQF